MAKEKASFSETSYPSKCIVSLLSIILAWSFYLFVKNIISGSGSSSFFLFKNISWNL